MISRHLIAAAAFAVVAVASVDVRAEGPARAEASSSGPLRLRVLTFNAFGIEIVAPAIEERMEAIPAAIFALSPDVVLVQELWRKRDAERFTDLFHEAGFIDVRSFGALHLYDEGKGGLFVASRYPIEAEHFAPFVDGTYPHIPYHLDWRGGKGFFAARIATPAGPLGILDSHLQASYEAGHYEATRIAQVTQLSESMRDGPASAVLHRDDPLLVGGDLNAGPDDPSMRLMELATGVRIGESWVETDLIAARSGARVDVAVATSKRVLLEPLRLRDGSSVRLSDHQGLLVDYLLGPGLPAGAPPREVDRAAVLAAVHEELEADATRTSWLRVATAVGSILSLLLALRTSRWLRTRRRRRDRVAALVFSLWCTFWCVWWAYTALAFAPHQLAMIRRVEGTLASYAAPPALR